MATIDPLPASLPGDFLESAQEHRRKTGRPLVTLSYAQSLDGSLAARRGRPLALSGPESLALTHRLRAAHDAILVGIGTVLSDDPRLTVRLAEGRHPRPVVLDSRLRLPDARLLSGPAALGRCLPECSSEQHAALEAAGARLCSSRPETAVVPLPDLLARLAGRGIDSLMVEGGAQVIQTFLSERQADQVIITLAPVFVGGLRALEQGEFQTGPAVRPLFPESAFPRIANPGYQRLGEDLILWGRLAY
jgi:3,4-dihydroxy 2-butanone 4-phosphate synthase/GTP cyclohydrolase II